jgi:hypothetical protein
MGICKLFFRIAHYLNENLDQLAKASLEDIAARYRPYAYIGARKHLREFVQEQAQEIGIDPAQWFGTNEWQKDSGAFPDFVLACEPHSPLGNGALLELKDSAGDQIASFNSTLPSARKHISRLTKMVRTAVQNYESKRGCACPDERDCFYLVRTKNKNQDACRLSIVQGTFFETIPNQELLKSLWKDLLEQSGVPIEQHKEILDYLAKLERNQIAESRVIERAAIKPRLRIMSEVVADANPHRYQEIGERTVNLILKALSEDSSESLVQWILHCFSTDNLPAKPVSDDVFVVSDDSGCQVNCRIAWVEHKLNGLHLVVQVRLDRRDGTVRASAD